MKRHSGEVVRAVHRHAATPVSSSKTFGGPSIEREPFSGAQLFENGSVSGKNLRVQRMDETEDFHRCWNPARAATASRDEAPFAKRPETTEDRHWGFSARPSRHIERTEIGPDRRCALEHDPILGIELIESP